MSVLPFADDGGELVSVVLRNVAFCLLALAVGDVIRSQREAMARAVAAREEETLRKVGEERLRIARELHDVVAHTMVAINVQAGVAAHLIDADPEQARSALRDIKATSGEALRDLRATLGVLRGDDDAAPLGPSGGLGDLDELAGALRAAGVEVRLDVGELGPVPASVHAAGYRIVQESLTNVLRHARATRARVRVAREGDEVQVEVTDDGLGGGGDAAAPATGCGGWRSGRWRCRARSSRARRRAAAGACMRGCRWGARRDRRRARRRPGARPRGLPRAARRAGRHRGARRGGGRRGGDRPRAPPPARRRADGRADAADGRAAGHGAAHARIRR